MDSHAHLTNHEYPMNAEDAISRASIAGISHIVNICTTPKELEEGLLLQEQFPEKIRNAGCTTPHDAHEETRETFAFFEKHAKAGNLCAIGETGFDDFILPANFMAQEEVCRSYIDLGQREKLPVIFHVRGDQAFEKVFAAAKEFPSFTGVIHCFTGTLAQAEEALALGWYISISGIATFKKSEELRSVIKNIPLDRLLIETDSPWLAPTGYRGKDNEPAYVRVVAETVAKCLGLSTKNVLEATLHTGERLFFDA